MNVQKKQFKAIIFDMDGLLIDSEPYWKIAEKHVFGSYGLALTDDLLRQVMGFRLSEVVQHWYNYQPWPDADFKATETLILQTVKSLIINHADAMPGVIKVLEQGKTSGMKMAIASSSSMVLIEAVAEKLKIRPYFDVVWSAEFEPYGKPHPGIFLTTAKKLGVEPGECMVFEDSINGVLAAKAARMYCVAVPEEATQNDPRFIIADQQLNSLESFSISSI